MLMVGMRQVSLLLCLACTCLLAPAAAAMADTPPTVPVNFSDNFNPGPQSFDFTVPEIGRYHVLVINTGTQDPLTVSFQGQQHTFSQPTSDLDLGALNPLTTYTISVTSGDGYDLDVLEVPPTLTNVSGGPLYVGRGGTFTAQYTLDRPATVQPIAQAGAKTYSGPLGPTYSPGTNPLTWDLRDSAGNLLPDGTYSVSLVPRNSSEGLPASAGQMVLDTTPPKIELKLDQSAGAMRTNVSLDVRDFGGVPTGKYPDYGVKSVLVSDDGGPFQDAGMTGPYPLEWQRHFVRGGVWTVGTHTVTVQATDMLDNTGSASISFTVPPPVRSKPDCSTQTIKDSVRASKALNRTLRRVGKAAHGDLFRHFMIAQRSCSDLTGDGVNELAVLLREQHGPKTVLAIFGRQGTTWALAFEDSRHRIDKISQLFYDATETLYGSKKRIRVHWDGKRFVLIRG
jgi:hypothetical protein